jgi:DNA-binding GntR family transcriptional regulator
VTDQLGEDPDTRPARLRVAGDLRSAIESGRYAAGSALPTYRQLAATYGVAVNTAMAAVRILRDEGLVTSKPNAGAYVRDRADPVDTEQELRSLRAELSYLRTRVHAAGEDLTAIEGRLTEVVARLHALDAG